jgi:8-oxo-dGTP pyrophosphatase MutT (NUDIX family)
MSRPGPAPPWAHVADAMQSPRRGFPLDRVRAALSGPVDITALPAEPKEAAVLVALFDEHGETRVVLTRRASTLRSHTSEVAFPGGRVDPGESLVAAALREAQEEVALEPSTVEVIGTLSPMRTVSTNALMTPIVGLLPGRPALHANPTEVERAFDVALADLLEEGVHRSEHWGFSDSEIEVNFFELPGDIIWGATARVLWELLVRVTVDRSFRYLMGPFGVIPLG